MLKAAGAGDHNHTKGTQKMITDKLLAFADGKALTTTADSDTIDLGKGGDEIARTLNLVVQLDDCAAVTPTSATITPVLKGKNASGSWVEIMSFPAVAVSACIAGTRLVNFAKLPLGMSAYSALKLAMTCSATLTGAKYSAWLTPSAEA